MGMATTGTTPKTVDTVDTSATLSRYVARVNNKFIFSRTGFHSYVCRRLDELEQGRCNRLILTCPPQHGKSTLVAEEFVSWHLGRHPDHRVVLASYSQTRSIRHGRASRERLRDPGFQAVFPSCKLWEGGSAAAASWQTTEGGGCISVGTGGSLTGETADLMVIDDPVANAEEANSPTMRENVWDWFLSVALTRLSERGIVAIIMTRWHLDDLVGRLLANQPGVWRHINFKAIAGPGDLLGRKSGEALFPEIKSAQFVTQQRNNLTRYWASALYDGEPVPRGGHLLDANTLRIVQPHDVPTDLRWVRGWDPAAVDKATSKSGDPDFTAGAKCAMDRQGNFWVADVTKWQLGWPKSRDRIKSIAVSENIPLFFEAQAAFKAAADNLCEVMPPNITVRTVDVSKDKVSRCNEWFALAEHGKVRLVAGPWVAGFLQAVEQFDGSGSYHDDEIDAVSIGYEGCSQSWWNAFSGQGEAGPSRFASAWSRRADRTADV